MKPKPTAQYQNVLRAIGQGLEILEVKSVELEVSDGYYLASGKCKNIKAPVVQQRSLAKSFLSLIRKVDKKKTTQTSGLPFHFSGLRFAPNDIELLDRKGKVLRSSENSSPPNPQSLSHILRMVGTYLEYRGSRLLRLSWDQQVITLWHTNRQDIEEKDVFTPSNLYDLWVHQFKKRKPLRVSKPTGGD